MQGHEERSSVTQIKPDTDLPSPNRVVHPEAKALFAYICSLCENEDRSSSSIKILSKLSIGFLRPKKVDRSYTFKIPMFTRDSNHFYLISIAFCVMPVCLFTTVVLRKISYSC